MNREKDTGRQYLKYILFTGVVLFPLLTLGLSAGYTPAGTRSGAGQENCLECHDDIGSLKHKHAVLEDGCETCHQPEGGAHPDSGTFTLTEKVPALCFMCHEEFTKKVKHYPVGEGECLSCHSPHGSDNSALLTEPQDKICLMCHDGEVPRGNKPHYEDFSTSCSNCHDAHQSDHAHLLTLAPPELCYQCHEEQTATSYPHAPVEKGECTSCHAPHNSGYAPLLTKDNKELCLECHDRTYENDSLTVGNIARILKNNPVVHGAMEMDGCLTCHGGHSTGNALLLKNKYPRQYYVEADADHFALCFDCHDAAILEKDPDASGTGFRDGKKNLHYVHIHGAKGRSCSMCHDVHAAKNAHLIREKVPYGNWTMKMNYKITPGGGSCMPGCHGNLSYDRNRGE